MIAKLPPSLKFFFNVMPALFLVVVVLGVAPAPVVVAVFFAEEPVAVVPPNPANAPLEASDVMEFAPAVATNFAAEIVLVNAGNSAIVKTGGSKTVNAFPALLDNGKVPGYNP